MAETTVPRKEYLERLIAWREKAVIKVVTGVRRCGKSTLQD
jgi:predicted AAA+ superfamily ATPase